MECVATDSAEVANVAWPDPFKATVASSVEPSMNLTFPVGVPEPGETAATVAVKVTLCPETDGFADEVSDVVVEFAIDHLFSRVADVAAITASLMITNVNVCDATDRFDVVNVALPEPFNVISSKQCGSIHEVDVAGRRAGIPVDRGDGRGNSQALSGNRRSARRFQCCRCSVSIDRQTNVGDVSGEVGVANIGHRDRMRCNR